MRLTLLFAAILDWHRFAFLMMDLLLRYVEGWGRLEIESQGVVILITKVATLCTPNDDLE